MKILICDKLDSSAIQELNNMGTCIDISTMEDKSDQLLNHIPSADLVFIRSATTIDKEVIDLAENLKIIARCGVGLDNVDISAASKKRIHVTNSPEANIISVAELTVGLIIGCARNIIGGNNSLKQKKWDRSSLTGIEFSFKNFAVPPVDKISMLLWVKCLANISMSLLSVTERRALLISTLPVKSFFSFEFLILSNQSRFSYYAFEIVGFTRFS